MKKLVILLIFVASLMFCMAARRAIVGSELATPNFPFAVAATWTSAGTEPDALAVGERTYKTIVAAVAAAATDAGDDEIEVYTVPYGTNAIRIRGIGITHTHAMVFNVLTGTYDGSIEDGEMVLRGTLTFTVGQQASTTTDYEMCDQVALTAASDAASTSDWTISNPGDVDTCAEAMLDLQGDDIVILVPTTLASDAKVLIKPY